MDRLNTTGYLPQLPPSEAALLRYETSQRKNRNYRRAIRELQRAYESKLHLIDVLNDRLEEVYEELNNDYPLARQEGIFRRLWTWLRD